MKGVVALRVDRSGNTVAASDEGSDWIARAGTTLCHRVVGAKALNGESVCSSTCDLSTHDDEGRAIPSALVVVRGEVARLNCHRLGAEAVVFVEGTGHPPPTPDELLTSREREVLSLVAEGHSTREIAKRLGVQASTIRTHVEHLCRRLNVRTRAQAVARAQATGQLRDE